MKVLAVGTLKGGAGKTTVAFNLAGSLAQKNKVLIIDADPQSNISSDANVDVTNEDSLGIRNILTDISIKPEYVVIKHPIEELPSLDIIPSNILLTGTEMNMVNAAGRERILANYISEYYDFFNTYDYIIIDTNPSMGIINQNVFYIADSIILISDISANAMMGTQLFMYLWEKNCKALGIENTINALIINNYDKRTKLSSELLDEVKDNEIYDNLLVKTVIPIASDLKRTSGNKKPICILNPKHPANDALNKIIKELKKKGVL